MAKTKPNRYGRTRYGYRYGYCELPAKKNFNHKRYHLSEETTSITKAKKYRKLHIKDGDLSRISSCGQKKKRRYGVYVHY